MLLQLSQLQAERNKWVEKNFGVPTGADHSIFGAVEEIGELVHHHLKLEQGIRGTREEHVEGILDSVGDCVVYLAGVCSWYHADYGVVVQQTWDAVKTRDWVKYPTNGKDH